MKAGYLFSVMILFSTLSFSEENSFPLLSPPLPGKPGSRQITVDDLLDVAHSDLNNTASVKWIDDHRIIYRLPLSNVKNKSSIYLYDLKNHASSFLTIGESPVLSPNRALLIFIKTSKEDQKQLWLMNLKTQESKEIPLSSTALAGFFGYNYAYTWSFDSKNIILTRCEDTGYQDNEIKPLKTEISLIDISSNHSKALTSVEGIVPYMSWLPNTEQVLFALVQPGINFNHLTDKADLTAINLKTSEMQQIIKFDGLQQFLNPQPSHNGKSIAIMYDAEHPYFTLMTSLGIVSANRLDNKEQNQPKQITHDQAIFNPLWSIDDKSIYTLRSYGPYAQLYKVNLSTSQSQQLTHDAANIKSYDLSPDGLHLAWVAKNVHGQNFLILAKHDGSESQQLISEASLPNSISLSEVKEIEWKSPDYPIPMRGLLVFPLHYKKDQSYPLVVDIHGGDMGATLNWILMGGILTSTPLEWQLWAAKGYAVFIPEFRSSGALGSLGIDRDLLQNHDRLGGDLNDIEAGVSYLIAKGIADPNRLGVFGHSAGGLRANWFAVSTHRYKAIASHEGWAEELAFTKAFPSQRIYDMTGGTPEEVPENYIKNSPLYFTDQATTPILFLMGNPNLGGIPKTSVFEMYKKIKNRKVETDYLVYQDEGHTFQKRENQRDALLKIMKWMNEHLMQINSKKH